MYNAKDYIDRMDLNRINACEIRIYKEKQHKMSDKPYLVYSENRNLKQGDLITSYPDKPFNENGIEKGSYYPAIICRACLGRRDVEKLLTENNISNLDGVYDDLSYKDRGKIPDEDFKIAADSYFKNLDNIVNSSDKNSKYRLDNLEILPWPQKNNILKKPELNESDIPVLNILCELTNSDFRKIAEIYNKHYNTKKFYSNQISAYCAARSHRIGKFENQPLIGISRISPYDKEAGLPMFISQPTEKAISNNINNKDHLPRRSIWLKDMEVIKFILKELQYNTESERIIVFNKAKDKFNLNGKYTKDNMNAILNIVGVYYHFHLDEYWELVEDKNIQNEKEDKVELLDTSEISNGEINKLIEENLKNAILKGNIYKELELIVKQSMNSELTKLIDISNNFILSPNNFKDLCLAFSSVPVGDWNYNNKEFINALNKILANWINDYIKSVVRDVI